MNTSTHTMKPQYPESSSPRRGGVTWAGPLHNALALFLPILCTVHPSLPAAPLWPHEGTIPFHATSSSSLMRTNCYSWWLSFTWYKRKPDCGKNKCRGGKVRGSAMCFDLCHPPPRMEYPLEGIFHSSQAHFLDSFKYSWIILMFNIYQALILYSHWAKFSTEMLSMT